MVSTTLMAQALIENKDYAHAKQELQRNLSKAEKLGLRLQNAKIHFLLGRALRLGGHDFRSNGAVPRGVAIAG